MKKTIILTGLTLLALAGTALAATVTSTFNVTATAAGICRVKTPATTVAFGSYDPTDPLANDAGSGTVTIKCTKGTIYWTYITGNAEMAGGGETLNFDLYSDAGPHRCISHLTGSGATSVESPTNADNTITYYGRIPAQQDVKAGDFSTTPLSLHRRVLSRQPDSLQKKRLAGLTAFFVPRSTGAP